MSGLLSSLNRFAALPDDTKENAFRKLLILIVALSCSLCGVIWGLVYYAVFGFGVVMLLPFSFVVIVGSAILIAHFVKNETVLVYAQLFCIVWITTLIQWTIGSRDGSGLVISWSFLGPLGALIFLSVRQAAFWMLQFVVVVVISVWYEPALLGDPLVVREPVRILFYIMNIGVSLIVVFITLAWFVQQIKREKQRSDELADRLQALFGKHVSKEIAEELITHEGNGGLSRYFDATVMFVDIRDFTVFADSRAPREVGNFQNTVFGAMINIIRNHKGIVLQALGDGIMAVFGAPVENTSHASDAVDAGLAMLAKVRELTDQGEITETTLGIGVHSGKVIAGEVGNDYRKFYILSGSNVIIAARIEQLNKDLGSQFLVSESVCERIGRDKMACVYKGEKNLKGISKPIGIYQLV